MSQPDTTAAVPSAVSGSSSRVQGLSPDAEPVVIEINVEATRSESSLEFTAAEWAAMTPLERGVAIEAAVDTEIANSGGAGWNIVSGASEDEVGTPPTRRALLEENAALWADYDATSTLLAAALGDRFSPDGPLADAVGLLVGDRDNLRAALDVTARRLNDALNFVPPREVAILGRQWTAEEGADRG